ncbi:hypothetical protein E4U17_003862 [Claviceps sp. LM77 group G4]|nr:hypothetical protein E4U17_003862 [Claviceps sp. LM77 group G4]
MGRELQKKKRRSKRQPVRQPNKTKKILNPRGNNIIAQNWNKNETLAQNYRRLGLLARLKAPAGGTEKKLATGTSASTVNPTLAISKHDPFAISNLDKAIISEAKVERDADGKIIRILSRSHIEKANPLNDPLRALDSDSEAEDADADADTEYPAWGGLAEREAAEDANTTDIVRSLIEQRLLAPLDGPQVQQVTYGVRSR